MSVRSVSTSTTQSECLRYTRNKQGRSQGGFLVARKPPLRSAICLFVEADTVYKNVRSEAGLKWQGKLKPHDSSEDHVNTMATKASVKASLPSFHDKSYPSLGLCVPQAILGDSTLDSQSQ